MRKKIIIIANEMSAVKENQSEKEESLCFCSLPPFLIFCTFRFQYFFSRFKVCRDYLMVRTFFYFYFDKITNAFLLFLFPIFFFLFQFNFTPGFEPTTPQSYSQDDGSSPTHFLFKIIYYDDDISKHYFWHRLCN